MKKIGVASVDDFIEKVNDLVDQFSQIVDPVMESNAKILELVGFKPVPFATIEHALVGMFLTFGVAMKGDYKKLGITFEDKSPYVMLSLVNMPEITDLYPKKSSLKPTTSDLT